MKRLCKDIAVMMMTMICMLNVSCPQNGNVNMFFSVGREVDQEPPTVAVTSNKNGDFMPQADFTLSGKHSDNIGTTKVVVKLQASSSDSSLTKTYTEDNVSTSGSWSVTFGEGEMTRLNIFEGDGTKVTFSISAYDAMDNVGYDSLFVYVDTSAPTITWQKPDSTTRFYNTDHELFVSNRSDFDNTYSIDTPSNIGYYHNKDIILSGFVEDNYSVSETYLRFKGEDGSVVAVTPVINQNITSATTESDWGVAPEIKNASSAEDKPKQIGSPMTGASPMSWKFTINSKELTEEDGWYKVEIYTKDGANNERTTSVSPEWLYIRQDADIPRNNYNFGDGDSIAVRNVDDAVVGGIASGVAFDDDGVKIVYVAIVPNNDAAIEQITSSQSQPTSWITVSDKLTDSKTDQSGTSVYYYIKSSDTTNGSPIVNWAVNAPTIGGDYAIFTVPYDIHDTYPTDWSNSSSYKKVFHVQTDDDPNVSLDVRVGNLEANDYYNDYYIISGSFYDNEDVTKINAKLVYFDGDVTSDNEITIFELSKYQQNAAVYDTDSESEKFHITKKDTTHRLSTGQLATQYFFDWKFTPSLFDIKTKKISRKMTFKQAKVYLYAYDDDDHSGNDNILLYGDSERPTFSDMTPANNSQMTTTMIFSGKVTDNVNVVSLEIKCNGALIRKWKKEDGDNTITGTLNDNGSELTFSTSIAASETGYGASEFTITAKDCVGNDNVKTINIQSDTTAPTVIFDNVTSGAYLNNAGSFNVTITAPKWDENNCRELKNIELFIGTDKTPKYSYDVENDKLKSWTQSFDVSDVTLDLTEGDVSVTVTATDKADNKGSGTLYFIYDKTDPYGMEITVPTLLDESGINALEDTTADIKFTDITYYLNNTVTFKGIGADNYKVEKTVVTVYKSDGTKVGTVSMSLTDSGDLTSDAKDDADAAWEAVSNVSGVPSNYSFDIDTSMLADGNYYMTIASVDAAGNEAESYTSSTDKRYFKILQDADIPQINFNVDDGTTVFNGYEITGMAFDDDGFSNANKFTYFLAYGVSADVANDTAKSGFANNPKTITPSETTTYSFAIPDKCSGSDGSWTLMIQPIDKNGKKGLVYTLHLKVSSSEMPQITAGPTVTADTENGGAGESGVYKGKIKISGTAISGKSELNVKEVYIRMYNDTRSSSDETKDVSVIGSDIFGGWYVQSFNSAETQDFTFSVDTANWVSSYGRIVVELKTKNSNGAESAVARNTIYADNAKPVITINEPAANATVNGYVKFAGTVKDDSSIKMYISYHDIASWSDSNITLSNIKNNLKTKDSSPAAGYWYELGDVSTSWTHEFYSNLLTDGTTREIVVAAVDGLNNLEYAKVSVTIDQDSDRPVVTITDMDISAKTSSNYIKNLTGTFTGSVNDDDGVNTIQYKIGLGGTWMTPIISNSTFTYKSQEDGTQDIYLRVVDTKNTEFVSKTNAYLNAIKLKDRGSADFGEKSSSGEQLDTVIYVMVDTADPVITNVEYCTDNSSWKSIDNFNEILGGVLYPTLYVRFTATDANGISDKYCKLGNEACTLRSSSNNVYTYSIDLKTTFNEYDGYKTLELYAKDGAGKSASQSYQIEIDNAVPTITISSPIGGTVDKTISVSGTALDARSGISGLYVSYLTKNQDEFNALTADNITGNVGANTAGMWTKITNAQSWTYTSYDTTKITESNKSYLLAVAAIDNNKNVAFDYSTITIDQDNDRPEVTLSNLTLTGMTSSNRVWLSASNIYGVVSDLDGVVQSVDYYIGDSCPGLKESGWINAASNTNSFTIPVSDGTNDVYIRVVDADEAYFMSNNVVSNDAIRVKDGLSTPNKFGYYDNSNDAAASNTVMYLTVDTKSPVISDAKYYDYAAGNWNTTEIISSAVFGGKTRKTLKLMWTASDANGIADTSFKPQVVFNGLSPIYATLSSGDIYNGVWTCDVNLTDVATGSYPCTIKIKDIAAEKSGADPVEKSMTVKIDNDGPEIEYSYPNSGTEVYGTSSSNRVKSSVGDAAAMSSIYVAFTKSSTAPTSSDTTYDIINYIGTYSTFNLYFDGGVSDGSGSVANSGEAHFPIYNNLQNASVNLIAAEQESAQPLYVWLKGIDELGNEGNWTSLYLKVLAAGDKPNVTIEYPENDDTVGGTIRISGSTTIETEAVASVWLQIDPNYDGSFDTANWMNEVKTCIESKSVSSYSVETNTSLDTGWGIKTTGTKTWSLAINGKKEYNPDGDTTTRKMAIRAYAISTTDKVSSVSETVFTIDPNAPVFGGVNYNTDNYDAVVIRKSADDSIYKTYSDGMWIVDGKNAQAWKLYGMVEDDSGIKNLTLKYSINGGDDVEVPLVQDNNVKKSEWLKNIDVADVSCDNYIFNIPIYTGSATDYGKVVYTLEAEEWNTENPKTTIQSFTIYYDSQKPVLTGLTADGTITQKDEESDSFQVLSGKVTEASDNGFNQSGYMAVVLQPRRIISGKTYIIDPMLSYTGDSGDSTNDNMILASDLETVNEIYCRKLTASISSGSTLTLSVSPKANNIRPNGMCFIGGNPYIIERVSEANKTVVIDGTLSDAGSAAVYFAIGQVIDHLVKESGDQSAVFEYNSNGEPVDDTIDNGDGDQMKEAVTESGSDYKWNCSINARNIYDGTVTWSFTAFDQAGNYTTGTIDSVISNNGPRIAGVSFGTDANGDGDVTGDELVTTYRGWYDASDDNKVDGVTTNGVKKDGETYVTEFSCPTDSSYSVLTISDKIVIKPQIVCGNEGLTWQLLYNSTEIDSGDSGLGGSSDGSVRTFDIEVPVANLCNIWKSDVSNEKLTLIVNDKTPGGANSCTITISVTSLLYDGTGPKAYVQPFYWNSSTDNSVYYDGSIKGHIDLQDDLPDDIFDEDSGEYDDNDKVSGIIVFSGTVTDNVRVDSILASMSGFSTLNSTVVASRNNGTISAVSTSVADNGYKFIIDDDTITKDGNTVKWRLVWDSSKVSGVAALDRTLTISAKDKGKFNGSTFKPNSESVSGTRTVDVVPYVTKIETTNRSASGLKDTNIRSASGKYSILANNASNTITVTGYNFSTSDFVARLVNTSESAGTSVTKTTGGTKLTASASSTTSAAITNSGFTASGYLEIFSNGIRTLNNLNDNDAKGDYAGSAIADYAHYYNREPDYYTTKNVQLTDDRYILLFDMHTAQTPSGSSTWTNLKNAYYPVMVMNGDNPVFGYMNGSGGPDAAVGRGAGTGAGSYYPSHAMPQRAEFNGASGAEVYTEYLIKASAWDAMGMAVDEGGRYYNVSCYNRDGAAMSLIYDRYAELYTNGKGWGAGTGYTNYDGNWSYNADNNAITLDSMNYGDGILLGRYMYPKLIANGNSKTGTAKVYMAYYDDGTGEITFRNFQIINSTSNWEQIDSSIKFSSYNQGTYFYCTNGNLSNKYVKINDTYYSLSYVTKYGNNYYYTVNDYSGTQGFNSATYFNKNLASSGSDSSGNSYGQSVNFTENYQYDSDYTTGRLTAVSSGSKYYDMGITSDNHVVIVYYDEGASKLKLIYSTNAIDGSSPTSAVAWSTSSVSFPSYSGTYVSMTIDSSNGIHIAAFDASDADLKYFYLTSYSASQFTNITVDSYGSVGQWTGIAICTDSDNTELYGKPVITYYNSTETGTRESIKMAYPKAAIGSITTGIDASGYTTGTWEYMTVPAITPPQGGDSKFQKVCLGFDTAGLPVVGYCATNLEFGKWQPEE